MNILRRIFGKSLSPAWTITPGEIIWKLLPAGEILIGESRDVEKKTMSLFAVCPFDGTTLFTGVTLGEPWWIALEMTVGEVALLHMFPRPDLPNTIGVTAIDCRSGKVLWSNPGYRALCGIEEMTLVQRGDSLDWSNLALVDARTGALLEEIGGSPERVRAFQEACELPAMWEGWINSEELDPDSTRAIEIGAILTGELAERRGPVEIATVGDRTVVGVHVRSRRSADAMLAGLVDTHLLVIGDGAILHHEVVTKDAPGPSSDIFFIWRGILTYIRDRRTLVGINLMKE